MSPADGHAERVREVFSQQAAAFEDPKHNHALTQDSAWLFDGLQCGPQDMLLDVAAGTGHAARALASRVRAVVAIDLTQEMLQAGRVAAQQAGIANVIFQHGDALALPFLDESFDVVISRFATHHIERPGMQLAEMARCLRPGGRLALADVLADEDPEVARRQNALEQMRDCSHTRTLSARDLVAKMERLGLEQIEVQARPAGHRVESWLHRADSPSAAAAVRAQLLEEIDGGLATGLQPFERDGELWLTQVWGCVSAVKPVGGAVQRVMRV